MKPEKVIKNGCVAVLVSPGFGAGWSTWADEVQAEMMMFDKRLVDAYASRVKDIKPLVEEIFGDEFPYTGGWEQVGVRWVPVGSQFRIEEYDGNESLVYYNHDDYYVA